MLGTLLSTRLSKFDLYLLELGLEVGLQQEGGPQRFAAKVSGSVIKEQSRHVATLATPPPSHSSLASIGECNGGQIFPYTSMMVYAQASSPFRKFIAASIG